MDEGFQSRQVRLVDGDQASLFNTGMATGPIAKPNRPFQDGLSDIQFLMVGQNLNDIDIEPITVLDAEVERQPIGGIDQIFILDGLAGDVSIKPVVAAGDLGAGVMNAIRLRFRSRSPGRKVTIAEGAERFARGLLWGIEVFVDEFPTGHDQKLASLSPSRFRNRSTAAGFSRR